MLDEMLCVKNVRNIEVCAKQSCGFGSFDAKEQTQTFSNPTKKGDFFPSSAYRSMTFILANTF
jgi:hypothetical protein